MTREDVGLKFHLTGFPAKHLDIIAYCVTQAKNAAAITAKAPRPKPTTARWDYFSSQTEARQVSKEVQEVEESEVKVPSHSSEAE